jgi:hypothetical protein
MCVEMRELAVRSSPARISFLGLVSFHFYQSPTQGNDTEDGYVVRMIINISKALQVPKLIIPKDYPESPISKANANLSLEASPTSLYTKRENHPRTPPELIGSEKSLKPTCASQYFQKHLPYLQGHF